MIALIVVLFKQQVSIYTLNYAAVFSIECNSNQCKRLFEVVLKNEFVYLN